MPVLYKCFNKCYENVNIAYTSAFESTGIGITYASAFKSAGIGYIHIFIKVVLAQVKTPEHGLRSRRF